MRPVIACWLLGIAILAGGAWIVCPNGQCGMTEADRIGLTWAHALRSSMLDPLMHAATWLGSLKLLLPTFLVGTWLVCLRGGRREAVFLATALLGSAALSHLAKLWVARPRPELYAASVVMPEDWSYPSAHTMQVTAAGLALVLASRRPHRGLALLLVTIVLLVSLSRIYLQVHFPSDVIAGMLAAACWVVGLFMLMFGRIQPGKDSNNGNITR
ncbi:phosphatase PAP2 family protein [Betaproteobacteria bacterium SCN2]|jgi:undecaprenyl-diphosphatase|nr:phosphatase PAP2 family protein [Betaproteobacteria bacterium SCN2]